MASVKSAFRTAVKPVLFKLLGNGGYEYVQSLGKIRDIDGRLVEEAELELYPRFIGEADEVLDIGANYAYHVHRMAKLCPRGMVHAFEPIPFTYRVCKRIVAHYGLKNVELHQLGVGAVDETTTFRVPKVGFGGIAGGQSHIASRNNELDGKAQHYQFDQSEEVACRIVALDGFLTKLSNLTFVKMDIEGAEYFALKGMRGLMAKFAPVVMLEINPFFLKGYCLSEDDLRTYFGELGYAFFRYDSERRRLAPHSGPFVEANYIALTKRHQAKLADILGD